MNIKVLFVELVRIILVSLILMLPAASMAEQLLPEAPTKAELELLPKACDARLNGDNATRRLWDEKIGPDNFLHLHHFCFALNFVKRAKFSVDKRNKGYYLGRAIQNFDYVLKAWPANSPLRPDAEAGKKEAQMMLITLKAQ